MRARAPYRHVRPVETVLKAAAYRRRMLLLAALARRQPQELRALSADLGLPLKTVSRNLRILERAGLVEGTIVRGRACYRLSTDAPRLAQAVTAIVVHAVRDDEDFASLPGHGGGVRAGGARPGWLAGSWARVRQWLARWTSSW